jgi:hypothetical protein
MDLGRLRVGETIIQYPNGQVARRGSQVSRMVAAPSEAATEPYMVYNHLKYISYLPVDS